MKDCQQDSSKIVSPPQSNYYKITGRIRDKNNLPANECMVQAFDKDPVIYFHPDNRLGNAVTDDDGSFEIIFDEKAFDDWLEGGPDVYLLVIRQEGTIPIRTKEKENATRRMDFQVKLDQSEVNILEPNLYAGNLARMISAFRAILDMESLPSSSDVRTVVELLLRAISSWTIYRDELARYAGYDGIQVPSHPRRTLHNHVTRWDRPILPI